MLGNYGPSDEIKHALRDLENNLKTVIKKHPKYKHILWDSYQYHRKRYESDLILINTYCNKTKRGLDVGSSPCHLLYLLSKLDYKAVGLDINPKAVEPFTKLNNLDVRECDIETDKVPFANNSFDFVVFNEIFEHLKIDPISTLKKLYKLIKPKGILFLSTPNLYALHKIVMFNLGMGFNNALVEFKKQKDYGYMGHIREYSTNEMEKLLNASGFKVQRVIYRNYNSYSGNDYLKSLRLKPFGYLLDILTFMIPKWRFSQMLICTK